MPFKRKKSGTVAETAHRSAAAATLLPDTAITEKARFGDNLVKILGTLGFHQMFPSPVEERQWFLKHPYLAGHYRDMLLDVNDAGGKEFVLAPTHLVSTLRHFLDNLSLGGPRVAKWFYLAPTVLVNNGKLNDRQHELGIFVLGEGGGLAYAQLLHAVTQFLRGLKIENFLAEINSLGCLMCQKEYFDALRPHLQENQRELCEHCRESYEERPLAVFGCSKSACQGLLSGAPQIIDNLDDVCRGALVGVLEAADELGIPYNLNPTLAHGILNEHVLFRILIEGQNQALGYGGNHSPLVIKPKESPVPLLGFLTTLEQLWEVMPEEHRHAGEKVEVFLMSLGEVAARKLLVLHRELLDARIKVAESILGCRGIRNQLKEAQFHNAEVALIIGQKEALDETVILRDMRSGMQEVLAFGQIVEEVKKRLGK